MSDAEKIQLPDNPFPVIEGASDTPISNDTPVVVDDQTTTEETPKADDTDVVTPTEDPKADPIDDQDVEPSVRKLPNSHFVKLRQKAKQAKQADPKDGGGEDDQDVEDDDEPDTGHDKILNEVKSILDPILQQQNDTEIKTEIGNFLKDNPDFASYQDKVLRFAKHESRSNIPISSIFYEVAGPDLLRIGAERKAEADRKAKDTQTGGGSPQHVPSGGKRTAEDVWNLTPQEFEAEQMRVRMGK